MDSFRTIALLLFLFFSIVGNSQFKREWSIGEFNISYDGCAFQRDAVISHSGAVNLLFGDGQVILKKIDTENLLVKDSISLNQELNLSKVNCSGLYNYNDSLLLVVVNSLQSDSSWIYFLNENLRVVNNINLSAQGSFSAVAKH